MYDLENKKVLVVGLGPRGRAACSLLAARGALVTGMDAAAGCDSREEAESLRSRGVKLEFGASTPPAGPFDLVVMTPAMASASMTIRNSIGVNAPVISELELGFQLVQCMVIAVAGSNGKGTTSELIVRMLQQNQRTVESAGHRGRPICSVVEHSRDLDFMVLQIEDTQLELTTQFRTAVSVLLNLPDDRPGDSPRSSLAIRAAERLLANQQAFDWAIIQAGALARLQEAGVAVPAKTISFSSTDSAADLHLDRTLLVSRLGNWDGPLLDMDHCQLRGPHNAENLMAAIAVGHVLRLPLETMVDSLKTSQPGRHRFELVAEVNGVQFINDAKASNLLALREGLRAARAGTAGQPNVWLISGGNDQGLDYHTIGPALSMRVKRAFLVGDSSEKIRSAWSLFTPCANSGSLLEATIEAAKHAASGDVVLFSPACSGSDQFRDYQQTGEMFCQAVKSIGRGVQQGHPNIHGETLSGAE
jgi:UDP-N-acetylmuramoylalanine--D-glutamate ligase